MAKRKVLVIGVGNDLRGDDGAGIEIVRRLRSAAGEAGIKLWEAQGEPTALVDAWDGADAVVLIDTMRSGEPAGTTRRFDASRQPLPARLGGSSSTHAFALEEAIELGRAVRRLPPQVIVFAIEGRSFEAGKPLCKEVEAATSALAETVLGEAIELARANPENSPYSSSASKRSK